ncbi:MAG: elongation factor P [Proteobacteria bacterium]|nr:elongation factor P [Pseudomonadota bacterium]
MKMNGNAIRPGNVIEHKGGLWRAVRIKHTQPGKGGAYLQVELKNLKDGSKLNERFRAAETVERVRLETHDFQYLYEDGGLHTFMNKETYDQVQLSIDDVGDAAIYLQDGMDVMIEFHEETPLGLSLPETIALEVSETEPVVKGQTAANSNKPATLANGLRVMVPPFIKTGDVILISPENGEYVKRAE